MNNIMSLISPGDVGDISGKATPSRTAKLHTQQDPVAIEPPIAKHEAEAEEFEYIPIADVLKAQRADGTYRYATNISQEQRDQLVCYAEQAQARKEVEFDQTVQAALADGRIIYSNEQLKILQQNGKISDRQYATYKGWNESFFEKQSRIADYQATQQEKSAITSREQQLDHLLLSVCYDDDGRMRRLNIAAVADAAKKAKKICGSDYGQYGRILKKLNSQMEKDYAFRDTTLYNDGEILMASMKAEKKFFADRNWSFGSDNSTGAVQFIERNMRIDLENFVQSHPSATTGELNEFLSGRLEFYNKKTVAEIGEFALQRMKEHRGAESLKARTAAESKNITEGTTGNFKGKKVVFKQGRWEYAK